MSTRSDAAPAPGHRHQSSIPYEIASGNGFQAPPLYGYELRPTSQRAPGVSSLITLSVLASAHSIVENKVYEKHGAAVAWATIALRG